MSDGGQFADVPEELKAEHRWVVWKWEAKKDKPGEFTKVPYRATAPWRKADSTDPETWATFPKAREALSSDRYGDRHLSGPGFVLGDGFAAVDLDHCVNPDTQEIEPWAMEIVSTLNSYTEFSPSGTGVHIFVRGTKPDGRCKRARVEMYGSERYLTVTGKRVPNTVATVEERTDALRRVHNGHLSEPKRKPRLDPIAYRPPSNGDDTAILDRARRAKNGFKFVQLYDLGDWQGAGYGSQSEADLALCSLLTFSAKGDAAAVDRLFRTSALMRDKWDERHGQDTYGNITIGTSLASYTPPREWAPLRTDAEQRQEEEAPNVEVLPITWMCDVEPEDVSWLWPGRIPIGKLTIIEGHPGVGKGMLSAELAACATTGRPLHDGVRTSPIKVLLIGIEDAGGDTVRPRLDAAGADVTMVAEFSTIEDRLLTFPRDTALLRRAIEETGAKLVIIDPITNHMDADLNPYKDVDVRRALTPLAKLAEEMGITIVVVRHLVKAGTGSAITAGSGSIAFVGVARCVLVCAKDPEDDDRRVLAVVKNNLSRVPPSLSFRLDETANGRPRVVWMGTSTHSADDLVAAAKDDGERGATAEAVELLREWLCDGEKPKSEIIRRAADLKITTRTIERAAQKLKVASRKAGFGADAHQVWRLPMLTIPANMASMEKNETEVVARSSPSMLAKQDGEHESVAKVVSMRYPCPGKCGKLFSVPLKGPCADCRQRSPAA